MPNSITLPCGKTAVVEAFNGRAQKLLNKPDNAARPEFVDLLLREVLVSLGERTGPGITDTVLLELPTGSRWRILIEARRQAYPDPVRMRAACPHCAWEGRESTVEHELDLALVDDVRYPADMAPVPYAASNGMSFAIGWGTGRTERAFFDGLKADHWTEADEGLARVVTVDGKPKGMLFWEELRADVLDEVRVAARRMTPVLLLDARDREAEAKTPAPGTGGPRLRIQQRCGTCRRTFLASLESQPDFLFRGLRSMLASSPSTTTPST
jgi:hypothetical protein